MSSDDKTGTAYRSTAPKDYDCPGCGAAVPSTDQGCPIPARCPTCEIVLWCTKRIEHGVVFLDAIPQPKPEISDVAKVGESLQHLGTVGGVIVNLSAMETVNSSFVAGLLVLLRLVETAGGSLTLSEVPPHVLEILERLKLNTLFVIKGQDALRPT